jgi:hypothetical protein
MRLSATQVRFNFLPEVKIFCNVLIGMNALIAVNVAALLSHFHDQTKLSRSQSIDELGGLVLTA